MNIIQLEVLRNNTRIWKLNSLYHREDGPAITTDFRKAWFQKGSYYRIGGPAVIWSDGTKEWFLGGQYIYRDANAIYENN